MCVPVHTVCFRQQTEVAKFRFHFYSSGPLLTLSSGQCGRCFFMHRKNTLFYRRENKQRCRWNREGRQNGHRVRCLIVWTLSVCRGENNAVTVGTLFFFLFSLVYPNTHPLPQYCLLVGVRGYVFGPIEEKGNITSPVSIKSERQIRLRYCLGE